MNQQTYMTLVWMRLMEAVKYSVSMGMKPSR